jgi:hypothetical protein
VNGADEDHANAGPEGGLPGRLGEASPPGDSESRTSGGPSGGGDPDRAGSGPSGSIPEASGDHWGNRPHERVPHPREVETLEEGIAKAFREGDPAQAWLLSQKLIELAREAVAEASRSRFKVNFGTPRCERCDGLKAGPDVAATCYQVRQCHYGNIKQGDLTPKQSRVLRLFLGTST